MKKLVVVRSQRLHYAMLRISNYVLELDLTQRILIWETTLKVLYIKKYGCIQCSMQKLIYSFQFSSVHHSVVSDSLQCLSTLQCSWTAAHHASLSITNSWSSLKLTPIESVMPSTISSSVVPFSSCPQSLPASVFSNKSTFCMRWPKYWSFSFSIIPPNEYSGLISFRMD